MPLDKDYVLAYNRGLLNTFQKKYILDAFSQITMATLHAETLPKSKTGLTKFAETLVEDAFGEKFKSHLIKQIVKSISEAPEPNVKHGKLQLEDFQGYSNEYQRQHDVTNKQYFCGNLYCKRRQKDVV